VTLCLIAARISGERKRRNWPEMLSLSVLCRRVVDALAMSDAQSIHFTRLRSPGERRCERDMPNTVTEARGSRTAMAPGPLAQRNHLWPLGLSLTIIGCARSRQRMGGSLTVFLSDGD
jgi:hypothetical protein